MKKKGDKKLKKQTPPKGSVAAKVKKILKQEINLNSVVESSLVDYSEEHLGHYGAYVVEDRAIPDFRDGLKPVQRKLIYSMVELGLMSSSKPKKSARVVGDVLGKYHPHGDAAAYGALVGLANTTPKLVDGQGNWGGPTDPAAAMRYTECRLSKFAETFIVDPGYMKVIQDEANYDDTLRQPIILPSLLPLILVIGNYGGVAYGVRGCNPEFTLESVVDVVQRLLKTVTVVSDDVRLNVPPKSVTSLLTSRLRISAPYGSTCVSSQEDIAGLIETGRANLSYVPDVIANYSKKIIEIKSYSPGFGSSTTVASKADKIASLPDVSRWGSDCGAKRPHAGPYGAYYYVQPKRNISEDAFYDLADKVRSILSGSEYYNLGITIRSEGSSKFAYCTYTVMMANWIKYRVELELRYLDYLIGQLDAKLEKLDLLLFAVMNCDKILDAAKPALKAKDPADMMAKKLKIDRAKAEAILQLQLYRLSKLEGDDIRKKIADAKAELKQLKADRKDPAPRIRAHLLKSVKPFIKG